MIVKAYFETDNTAELIAIFNSEALYMKCVKTLETEAKEQGKILTEAIEPRDLPSFDK